MLTAHPLPARHYEQYFARIHSSSPPVHVSSALLPSSPLAERETQGQRSRMACQGHTTRKWESQEQTPATSTIHLPWPAGVPPTPPCQPPPGFSLQEPMGSRCGPRTCGFSKAEVMQIHQEPDFREKKENKVTQNWNERGDIGTDVLGIKNNKRNLHQLCRNKIGNLGVGMYLAKYKLPKLT